MMPLTHKQKQLLDYLKALGRFTKEELAAEAKRRGLIVGHIFRDSSGQRTFRAIAA